MTNDTPKKPAPRSRKAVAQPNQDLVKVKNKRTGQTFNVTPDHYERYKKDLELA